MNHTIHGNGNENRRISAFHTKYGHVRVSEGYNYKLKTSPIDQLYG